VVPSGSAGFTVSVTAGVGTITALHFLGRTSNVPGAPNYQIVLGGQQLAVPFDYAVTPPVGALTFTVVNLDGRAVTVPLAIQIDDGCGRWTTFVGAGSAALADPVTWSPPSLAVSVAAGTVVQSAVTLSLATALRSGDVVISPELGSYVQLDASGFTNLPTGQPVPLALSVTAPTGAAPGTIQGTITVHQAGQPVTQALPVQVIVYRPTAATVVEDFPEPTPDRIVVPAGDVAYVSDQLLVEFAAGTSPARIDAVVASANGTLVGKNSLLNWYQLRLAPGGLSLDQAQQQLRATPDVTLVTRSVLVSPSQAPTPKTPNDPEFDSWDQGNPKGNNQAQEYVRLPDAWSLTTGSKNVKVAIVDTQAYAGHDDLTDNVDHQVSEHGNGWSWFAIDHGTQVAGVIGARGDNGIGYAGVAWNVTLLLHSDGLQHKPSYAELEQLWTVGIVPAAAESARIVNISQGPLNLPSSPTERADLKEAGRHALRKIRGDLGKDVLIVFAAGNQTTDVAENSLAGLAGEAEFDNVVAVAGTEWCGVFNACQVPHPNRTASSNWGAGITIAAPATNISSTTTTCGRSLVMAFSCSSEYATGLVGTSFAAPFVSGVAALIYAYAEQLQQPAPTAAQVRRWLVTGAQNGGWYVCRDQTPDHCGATTNGIPVLNAYQALKLVAPGPPTFSLHCTAKPDVFGDDCTTTAVNLTGAKLGSTPVMTIETLNVATVTNMTESFACGSITSSLTASCAFTTQGALYQGAGLTFSYTLASGGQRDLTGAIQCALPRAPGELC